MRPENLLVHKKSSGCLEILLYGFGGAKYDELGLDGNQLPDGPLSDPTQGIDRSTALDMLSLGSVFYVTLADLSPYRSSGGSFGSVE